MAPAARVRLFEMRRGIDRGGVERPCRHDAAGGGLSENRQADSSTRAAASNLSREAPRDPVHFSAGSAIVARAVIVRLLSSRLPSTGRTHRDGTRAAAGAPAA